MGLLGSRMGGTGAHMLSKSIKLKLLATTSRGRQCRARDGEGLLEYMKRSPVLEDLGGEPLLRRDGGHVGGVLFPHMEGLMKPSKLRNKKKAGLLLLRIPVFRAASETSTIGGDDQEAES
jgi:hypothetical protein